MHVLIAPDKFKGSLSAQEVCEAIDRGIKKFDPTIKTTLLPLADGGEGSLDVVSNYVECVKIPLLVKDPLGRSIDSYYLLSQKRAFIEMALASGLQLLNEEESNPLFTTTYGTGELILDAIRMGAKEIFLFVGGSATNDMGIGMAEVLGYDFLDKDNDFIPPVGVGIGFITDIKADLKFDKDAINFFAVCDVNNPLYGEHGAAHVYAAQKGADPEEIEILDKGMRMLSRRFRKYLNKDVAHIPGSGAAGGMGAGIMAFLDGEIISGADFIFNLVDLDKMLKDVDFVITGEGRVDDQTFFGKTVSRILSKANSHDTPVHILAGLSEISQENLDKNEICSVRSVESIAADFDDSMRNARKYLEQLAYKIAKDLHLKT